MLFNSLQFLIFFPIVTAIFGLLPGNRPKQIWLFVASCVFYGAFIPKYLWILFFIIGVDYFAALYMEGAKGNTRRGVLWISLVTNIGVLVFFKYFNFGVGILEDISKFFGHAYQGPMLTWALPIGLSFHTFQAMTYTIEVYRGRVRAERDLLTYALYVMFYPQLVAGPIERPTGLLPQLKTLNSLRSDLFLSGLRLMGWGFFKKTVIADRLTVFVDVVFSSPGQYSALEVVMGCVFFSFQIYCDFSGYTDIAIGAAQTMGIQLQPNFLRPYLAFSVTEFWRRWHISLSSWFRDYVYIPLGGSRGSLQQTLGITCVVFLLSGLWHGAAWTFVCWGLIHGLLICIERLANLNGFFSKHVAIGRLAMFVVVTIAWIFFRAPNFLAVQNIFDRMGAIIRMSEWNLDHFLFSISNHRTPLDFCLGVGLCVALWIGEWAREKHFVHAKLVIPRWITDYGLVFSILFLGRFSRETFIYFQF